MAAVMTSGQARSFHWLVVSNENPLAAWNRALCGARPGGWVTSWALADENVDSPSPQGRGDWRFAPQVPACSRCEAKR